MSFSSHPSRALERGYARRVEAALVVAIACHAAAFALAPPYVARPYRLNTTPLRLVSSGGFGGGSAVVGQHEASAPAAATESVTPRRSPLIVTEQLKLSAQAAPETPQHIAPPGARGRPGTGAGAEGEAAGSGLEGADDAPPPVFYAFDSPPHVVTRIVPEYPIAAKASGGEGSVVLNANVDERGRVVRVWVARSTAPEILVESAIDALYRFRFTPGSQQGIPVKCTVAVPFNFRLNVHL